MSDQAISDICSTVIALAFFATMAFIAWCAWRDDNK